ncbi:hypothetical protein Tco_0518904 [Tanacetum coccineum]
MVVLMLSYSIKVMDPNSSLGKNCLGENVVEFSSDEVEGSGDRNSPEFQDTANSGQKKETKAMVFYQMDTEEVSDRFVAPCFVNGLEAYDGEINLEVEENMISNEYAVKLCLEHEFIINLEEDDVEPGVILGRSFLRMTKAITDFEVGTVTIYPETDPFLEDIEEEENSLDDWDHLLDFNLDDVPLLGEEELPPFVCKIRKKEERPIIETMAYHDKYKKILNEIWKDKVELDGKIVKEEEEAVNKNTLADTGSDINTMPYRIYEQLGREDMKKVGVTTFIANIVNTPERLFSTFDGFCHQTFRAARSDVMRNAESDSDDEEEYQIKRNKFGAPIYRPKPAPYLNCNDPAERSLAIQTHVNWMPDYKGSYTKEEEATGQWRIEIRLTDPYGIIYLQGFTTKKMDQKLSKYHKLSDIMSPNWFTMGTHDDEAGSSRSKRSRQHETVEEVLLPQVHHEFLLWEGCNRDAKSRLREAESNKEIFISVAWISSFNINEPIYAELCHEFYSTYEFDKVCADDERQTKKIIMFRLGGRAHSLTLLEFARRLGLYHADELEEDGFNVYFEGGLRSDEHFNAQETIGYDKIQKNDLWLLSMFDARHQNGVLTEDVVRSLSALIYCRDLDTTSLRDLIDPKGTLIPEDPQPSVPRVGIPRPPRASMQDLYDRMGRMEIRQEAIERMEYMQSYHWDMYQGVFEHMVGVYSVPLQGAYNPPGYAQP